MNASTERLCVGQSSFTANVSTTVRDRQISQQSIAKRELRMSDSSILLSARPGAVPATVARRLGAALVLGIATLLGCQRQASDATSNAPADHEAGTAAHDHSAEGPHHGHLIELGNEEYHAELTHDETAGKVTIYLLDGHAKEAVLTTAKQVTIQLLVQGKRAEFRLAAVPVATDPTDHASRFELADHTLLAALDAPRTKGRLNVTIDGKSFVGPIDHQEHEGHQHR
jgi:hypothetical protein